MSARPLGSIALTGLLLLACGDDGSSSGDRPVMPATAEHVEDAAIAPEATDRLGSADSSSVSSGQSPPFQEMDVAMSLESPFVRLAADPADLMVALAMGERSSDGGCDAASIQNLPVPGGPNFVRLLVTPTDSEPAAATGIERTHPNGVRVVYHGELSSRQEAFEQIAEQMARCVAEMPFREQGRNGMIRVELLDIGTLGDHRVAVHVSDVGPNSMSDGWTADYYWIGFAMDDAHLVAAALNEAWRGDDADGWPAPYPQPTISDDALASQLEAALAFAW